MKRPILKAEVEEGAIARVDPPKSLAKLTHVAELLCQPQWEDGSRKGQRCAMVFIEPLTFKILVKVENPPLKLMVSGRSWDDAWAALEAVLRSDDVPWEQDAPRDGGGKKRGK